MDIPQAPPPPSLGASTIDTTAHQSANGLRDIRGFNKNKLKVLAVFL